MIMVYIDMNTTGDKMIKKNKNVQQGYRNAKKLAKIVKPRLTRLLKRPR